MQILIGALIFGAGAFCGAVLYAAGQMKRVDQKDRLIKEKMQNAILNAFKQEGGKCDKKSI